MQGASAVSDDNGNLTSENIDLSICDNESDVNSDKLSNHDQVLSASNKLDVLNADQGTYSELADEIASGGNIELQHDYYIYSGSCPTIGISGDNRIIDGKGAVIDMAGSDIQAFCVYGSGVTIKNLTIKNANYDGYGAAIYFSNPGTVENCNFTDNKATSGGGAIYFYYSYTGIVNNCNFVNNFACYGGAIWINSGSVENCNFTNNTAINCGGAIDMGEGTVKNCNFNSNKAIDEYSYGGALYISANIVENCNFTNNTAKSGGAIFFDYGTSSNVTNCNFIGNNATWSGGAVFFLDIGDVTNCNFIGNDAVTYGGAIYFCSSRSSHKVRNCYFTNNSAGYGGALYFCDNGEVKKCNFAGNTAINGSAIYFFGTQTIRTVSNSIFLNNRANAEDLEVTKNDNNITIKFTGNDNLLNAIYSRKDADVKFNNVVYWGANGITNTGRSTIKPSTSKNEAGQNITVCVVVNDEIVLSDVMVTDENGMVVLDINAGENYFIGVRHDTDSYYTEAVKTISNNTKFSVNVTSQTTNNRTVNITAKSNIPNEIIKGKLLFILPNNEEISANYCGNGTWWVLHTFEDYGLYEVNVSFTGLDNVTIHNGTITILDVRLSVVKVANATEVAYNSLVQFTINVSNQGSCDATDVNVSDCLPEGLTFVETGVINSEGQYEVFDSLDLAILIDDNEFVTFYEFSSSDIIEGSGDEGDIVHWRITRISGGNSVVLSITARANGLFMGNITNEVTVCCREIKTDIIVNSDNVTLIPANSSVSAADVEVTYGEPIVVVVSSENATGVSYQIISSGAVVKEGSVNVGENINGLDLAAGEYTVNLTTIVNGNYTANSYTSKITVNRANSSISASDIEVVYGQTVIIPVLVVNASEFYYSIVNEKGEAVDSDIIQAGLNITVENLSAGKYNVTLITGVDSNHTSVINTSRITVSPAGSSVSAEDVVASFGDVISIPVSSVNATEVSYTITDTNSKDVANGTVKPGEAIRVSDLAAGDYTVSLTTVVDSNHTSVSNSSKLHIKHVVSIIIVPVTGRPGEVVTFTAQFNYENGDPVNEGTAGLTIKYGDKKLLTAFKYSILSGDESVPVSNGKAEFNVKLGNPGTYPYFVTYCDGEVDEVQAESTLTIQKVDTTVSCFDFSGQPADKKEITVTVSDYNQNPVANGTVTLTLNGKTYNASVENGSAVIKVVLPNPGEYNATVTYNGNDYYNSSTSSINVNVKVNTKALSVEDIIGKAGEIIDITVKFVDEDDNPIKNGTATLTIDGKTYTAEVVDGVATFNGVVLPYLDTIADVYYLGNDYYNASSTTFSDSYDVIGIVCYGYHISQKIIL